MSRGLSTALCLFIFAFFIGFLLSVQHIGYAIGGALSRPRQLEGIQCYTAVLYFLLLSAAMFIVAPPLKLADALGVTLDELCRDMK